MSELSERWRELPQIEQDQWKSKASDACSWSKKPKRKITRELTRSIDENVGICGDHGYLLCL